MSDFYNATYNPDVLNCLANLSNDEVFTPPDIVNKMLDMLPQELFSSKATTFLDPSCKSGVFLREIAKRLLTGLEEEIPSLKKRIDHIFHKQLFGIAITEMTSLLSRRSVYCSKYPNGKYSVVKFDNSEGNIRFKRINHVWQGEKCRFCGASKSEYDRDAALETHAYEFIHTTKPEEIFKMKFDVIIGNPPYQLDTGGSGRQAKPIYQMFVQQAKKLNPRFLTMIIPSRWFAGGMGLDGFREEMLNDRHIISYTDFANAKDCFPQNSISGGVGYFLWSRDTQSDCEFISINGSNYDKMNRDLREFSVMVRYNKSVSIIRKINYFENSLSSCISSISPFGLSTSYRGKPNNFNEAFVLHGSDGISYIRNAEIPKGKEYFERYKVLVSQTGAEHAGEPGSDGKFRVLTSTMKVIGKREVCTHSYILAGNFKIKKEADNLLGYLHTQFVRFLILQAMTSIHLSKNTFQFVPIQDFSEPWTDEKLYKKYNLTKVEIAFIESMIRPMEMEDE
jgi:site-specific DNA-methyltransferase (adenine-specific)